MRAEAVEQLEVPVNEYEVEAFQWEVQGALDAYCLVLSVSLVTRTAVLSILGYV